MERKVASIVKMLKELGAERVHISKEGEKDFTILVSAMDTKEYYLIRSYVFTKFKENIDMYCEITNPLKYHKYLEYAGTTEIK